MDISSQQGMWQSGLESGVDGTASHFSTSDTNDGFFSRPVRIDSFAWDINEEMYYEFNPWRQFFEDPRIANRLAHFRNLKATLHVQLMVNGNPFYYGRGVMSYVPLPDADQISTFRSSDQADYVEITQRPHIFFDPCTSEGGELVLPFVWPAACLNIPDREWRKMGLVSLRSLNQLRHANGGVEPLRITVFAYATDVNISTPTSRVPYNLEPQGGTEYGNISFPASRVSTLASYCKNMPMIGPFASATEMIASTVKDIAIMFGYSRPRAIPEQLNFVRHYTEAAITNSVDTSLSLALDSKKEITIDPRVCGLAGHDEMSIHSIATRECWMDSFVWSENDGPDKHLFSVDISPICGQIDTGGLMHTTPMSFVSLPFEYWKGSIEVRLQVVCSAYHRGRLRVIYDPDWVQDPGVYNINYSAMMDITESTEMTFKIGWAQELDYLEVGDLEYMLSRAPGSGIDQLGSKNPYANGRLGVYVVNDLTSPSIDDASIQVNVFVRACDDLDLASPTEKNIQLLRINRFPFRVPEDLDIIITQDDPALKVIYSAAKEPLRTDEIFQAGGIQGLPTLQKGVLSLYSNDNVSQPITYKFSNTSGVAQTVLLTSGGASYSVSLPVGTTSFETRAPLKPGFNRVPMSLLADNDSVDILAVTSIRPVDTTVVNLDATALLGVTTGTERIEYSSNPPFAFIQPVNVDDVVTITVPDAVPGSTFSVRMTRQAIVSGSSQRVLASLNVDPIAARVFSGVMPANRVITVKRDPANTDEAWNMEICGLTYLSNPFVPEGGEELLEQSDEVNAPVSETVDITMGPTKDIRGLNDVYFGERVVSLRQLLKRSTTCLTFDNPDGSTPATYSRVVIPQYPKPFTALTGAGYALASRFGIFNYFNSAFVCMRGGMRVKILYAKNPVPVMTSHMLSRLDTTTGRGVSVTTRSEGTAPFPYKYMLFDGSAVDSLQNKPYSEFELPYYSNKRFTQPRCNVTYKPEDSVVDPFYSWEPLGTNVNNHVTLNYSTAEDFSLSLFLSTPLFTST